MSKTESLMTPNCTLSYPQLFMPKAIGNGEPKYSAVFVFDPQELAKSPSQMSLLKAMNEAVEKAKKEKWGANVPASFEGPFKDGEKKEYGKGTKYISCSSKIKPGCIHANKDAITEPEILYAGCVVRTKVRAYAWEYMGKSGVSFGLGNIQKIADGDRLGGRPNPEDEFDAITEVEEGDTQSGAAIDEMFK